MHERHWEGVRLHVVTGKGGTGKTTVAAALALALAAGGRKVVLVEVEERQGLAQLFDVAPLPYAETKLAVAPGGGDVVPRSTTVGRMSINSATRTIAPLAFCTVCSSWPIAPTGREISCTYWNSKNAVPTVIDPRPPNQAPPAIAAALELHSLCEEDGDLYARYGVRVRHDPAPDGDRPADDEG